MDDERAELGGAAAVDTLGKAGSSASSWVWLSAPAVALVVVVPLLLSGAPTAQFERTYDSPKALAKEVLEGLAANDFEGLRALALSEAEFKDTIWPDMPVRGNFPVDYVWSDLRSKSTRALLRSLARHGGRRFELLDLRFKEGVTAYDTFVVYRQAQLLVRDEQGREGALDVMGSVVEKGGRYKLFSYVVDR